MPTQQNNEDHKAAIGEVIEKAMLEKGWSIRDLARSVGGTYENIRKIVRGASPPSSYLLRALCAELGIDYESAQVICDEDKIRKRYGDTPLKMSGIDPEMEPVQREWKYLSKQQKDAVVAMVQSWAKHNKSHGVSRQLV